MAFAYVAALTGDGEVLECIGAALGARDDVLEGRVGDGRPIELEAQSATAVDAFALEYRAVAESGPLESRVSGRTPQKQAPTLLAHVASLRSSASKVKACHDAVVSGPDPDAFSAISFDCYGTLMDWETGILAAMFPVLERQGVRASTDEILRAYARAEAAAEQGTFVPYREVLRRTFSGMAGDLGFVARPDEAETLIDALTEFEPFSDTIDVLRQLAERYQLAVISNVDEDLFAGTRDRLGVEFQWVVTAEAVEAYKPAGVVFERALARMGLAAGRVLHAAQSLYHDVQPAHELGIATVHVLRDSGREASAVPAVEARADWTVPDLRGLLALLES